MTTAVDRTNITASLVADLIGAQLGTLAGLGRSTCPCGGDGRVGQQDVPSG